VHAELVVNVAETDLNSLVVQEQPGRRLRPGPLAWEPSRDGLRLLGSCLPGPRGRGLRVQVITGALVLALEKNALRSARAARLIGVYVQPRLINNTQQEPVNRGRDHKLPGQQAGRYRPAPASA